jgi:hypothetical protein
MDGDHGCPARRSASAGALVLHTCDSSCFRQLLLAVAKARLGVDRAWLGTTRARLASAAQRLDQAFMNLRD